MELGYLADLGLSVKERVNDLRVKVAAGTVFNDLQSFLDLLFLFFNLNEILRYITDSTTDPPLVNQHNKGGRIPHKILPPCLAKNVYRLFRPEVHFSNRIVFDLDHGEIISVKMPFIKESIDAICYPFSQCSICKILNCCVISR